MCIVLWVLTQYINPKKTILLFKLWKTNFIFGELWKTNFIFGEVW